MMENKQGPWLRYLGLAAQLLVMIAVAAYGGIWLDKKTGRSPLFILLLPMLVLGGTFYKLIKETSTKNGKEK